MATGFDGTAVARLQQSGRFRGYHGSTLWSTQRALLVFAAAVGNHIVVVATANNLEPMESKAGDGTNRNQGDASNLFRLSRREQSIATSEYNFSISTESTISPHGNESTISPGGIPDIITNEFPLDELRAQLVTKFPYISHRDQNNHRNSLLYTKVAILGTQLCWADVQSPIPWMDLTAGGSKYMHYAFPHWSVNTGKCLSLDRQGLEGKQYAKLVVADCDSSNQVLVFDDILNDGTIRLLTDPDHCLTASAQNDLEFRPCTAEDGGWNIFSVRPSIGNEVGVLISPGNNQDKCIGVGSGKYENEASFELVDCSAGGASMGFMKTEEHFHMNLVIEPRVVDFQYTSLGETFMGNPGVQLPWDARHMVMYPWKEDHCNDGCSQPEECNPRSCVVPCTWNNRTSLCDGIDIGANEEQASNEEHIASNPNTENTQGKGEDHHSQGKECEANAIKSKVSTAREKSASTEYKLKQGKNPDVVGTPSSVTKANGHPEYWRDVKYLGFNTSYDVANNLIRETYKASYGGKAAPNLGLGEKCTGRCQDTSVDKPCSCGTLMAPGCHFAEGYDCMTDTSFIPEAAIFVGCNENYKQCDPAHPKGTYLPLLIPSGLDLRTCPDNVLDGRREWGGGNNELDSKNAVTCKVNDECPADEPFVGTMRLSGQKYRFCCPGETSNPFSPLSYGFFGVFPEDGHFGKPGMHCDNTGCTYRPVCGCPTAIPALNIKVSGPGRVLDTLFVPAEKAYTLDNTQDSEKADIDIAPILTGASNSTLRVYTVFMGSDDSFTAGDYVRFNSELANAFIEECKLPCAQRGECNDVSVPVYETNANPYRYGASASHLLRHTTWSFNPTKKWNVKKPPKSIFEGRKIRLAPFIDDGHLWMGPVFIGHPGKTYLGADPDLPGIFTSVFGRPLTGPGSAPGGTTSIGLERFKAFMQCKLSIYSGTEKDPRIVYSEVEKSTSS